MMQSVLHNIVLLFISLLFVASATAQRKEALLVGISDYGNPREDPDRWSNIHGANDVRLLAPLLKQQGYHTTTLINTEANAVNILQQLDKLAKHTVPGSAVWIHFSMHGQPVEDSSGDEPDGWDESLVPTDALKRYRKGVYWGQHHILDDQLSVLLEAIRRRLGPKGDLVVIVDACHAGTLSRGDEHVRGSHEGFSPSGKTYDAPKKGNVHSHYPVDKNPLWAPITMIEACRAYQSNIEVCEKGQWYGGLSLHIARLIESAKIDRKDDWVNLLCERISKDRRLRHQNIVVETSNGIR